MLSLLLLILFALPVLFIIGLVKLISAKNESERKLGIILMLIPVIVAVIGFGVCFALINLN
jgi:hypothetical protein